MPRGDKSKYTDKQKRQAEHIEDSYKEQGISNDEAERRAWATVNAETKGGKKPGGSGYGKKMDTSPSKKGGRKGGASKRRETSKGSSSSTRKSSTGRGRTSRRMGSASGRKSTGKR